MKLSARNQSEPDEVNSDLATEWAFLRLGDVLAEIARECVANSSVIDEDAI